jgi:hypothetical protein
VETITYVGIIGGSAYDYLAYVSYVREKKWDRTALRVILFDSILSFVAVLIFTLVFVSLGALVLAPKHELPAGTDLLTLQAQFVSPIFPWLTHVYFAGAFLAVFGTLYGTIEVAPAVFRETALAAFGKADAKKVRVWAVSAVCTVAGLFLLFNLLVGQTPTLIAIVTPANLFTGVLACGFVCLLSVWADLKWLKKPDRLPLLLMVLNAVGGVAFLALGVKGYFDGGAESAIFIFAGTIFAGVMAAVVINQRRKG